MFMYLDFYLEKLEKRSVSLSLKSQKVQDAYVLHASLKGLRLQFGESSAESHFTPKVYELLKILGKGCGNENPTRRWTTTTKK